MASIAPGRGVERARGCVEGDWSKRIRPQINRTSVHE